ncbi:ATP-dependent nuclease, partial [Brachybacterium alimentarium]|uniref:ATP-dependent nuclease n=1 Tax=Brachybacterium alimentarium TaxID=47845 RepID=UPI003FD2AF92
MELVAVRLENIGGFRTAEIDTSDNKLLIGENNSGKTSILRILNWVLNQADHELLSGGRELSQDEQTLLVPARATRNKARRIVLSVRIRDGRIARRYNGKDKIAHLRIQFRAKSTYARIQNPERGESLDSDSRAIELLARLQATYCAIYVAAVRDSHSQVLKGALRSALHAQFASAFYPTGPGVPNSARRMRNGLDAIKKASDTQSEMVWGSTRTHLHGIFDPAASLAVTIDPDRVLDFIVSNVEPTFSIGEHDVDRVPVDQLGAGTQSVLAMALTQLSMDDSPRKLLLLEEPEAFLHPSAQRTLAWQLFQPSESQIISTTHSPLVLAESNPSDVVVLKNHIVHTASKLDDLQESKDRYQLSTWAAGCMFERSVLLVEGASDLAFFEMLRRRLAEIIPIPVINRLRVAGVGGKASFGPWLRLLRRYRDPNTGSHAFNVIVCADSIDAGADILRAFRESSISMKSEHQAAIRSLLDEVSLEVNRRQDAHAVARRTSAANMIPQSSDVKAIFTPVDLEYAATSKLSDSRAQEFSEKFAVGGETAGELAAKLGSKGGEGKPSDSPRTKAPFL